MRGGFNIGGHAAHVHERHAGQSRERTGLACGACPGTCEATLVWQVSTHVAARSTRSSSRWSQPGPRPERSSHDHVGAHRGAWSGPSLSRSFVSHGNGLAAHGHRHRRDGQVGFGDGPAYRHRAQARLRNRYSRHCRRAIGCPCAATRSRLRGGLSHCPHWQK